MPDIAASPTLLIDTPAPSVALLTLNRPEALNALNREMTQQLAQTLETLANDDHVRVVILTGAGRAFAAGGDISEMVDLKPEMGNADDFIATWEAVARFKKPIIAAINGYALGGGCEIAMMCDCVIASETAVFGQPEAQIGVIPGAGGTQRLTRAVGKALAMDMILTGRRLSAPEALQAGLVSRVVAPEHLLIEAIKMAEAIAQARPEIQALNKAMVNLAMEKKLHKGIIAEREAFYGLFGGEAQQSGMRGFLDRKK
ncbi:MAG: enoyl-CoA hydratase-related protein [Vampirovibrionales bacterium]|nr:enoyl-CoA hydratase-related protein [Vampirovibrionales bacterium]